MTDAPLALRIARFAHRLRWDDLSAARRRKARWLLVDFVGSTLAGSTLPEATSGYLLAEPGSVRIPGDDRGWSPRSAATLMGTLGALLQIHDGYGGGGNHPCSAIVSALWASRGPRTSIDALLGPLVVGYEVANRLAGNSHPAQTLHGTAPTSTTGTLGAAAAVACLRGLSTEATARAITIAAFVAPLAALRGLTEHGSAIPLHGGLAARAGMEAVELAIGGLDAGATILEGGRDPGFLQVIHGDAATLEPETWRGDSLDGVFFKPLPACRHAQPAIEAVLAILGRGPIDVAQVAEVVVHTYPVALMFGQPPRAAHDLYDRLMSTPWAIASTLVHGGFGFDNVIAPAADPRVSALYPRIRNVVDPAFAADYPRTFSTRVEVVMRDGRRHAGECRMLYGVPAEYGPYSPPGTTTPPLDDAGMRRKFLDLAGRRLPVAEARRWLDEILGMEHIR